MAVMALVRPYMGRMLSLQPKLSGSPAKKPWYISLSPSISESGKRERHFFETKEKAQTFGRQQRARRDNVFRNSSNLTPGQQEQAASAFEKLGPYGVSLNTVVTG